MIQTWITTSWRCEEINEQTKQIQKGVSDGNQSDHPKPFLLLSINHQKKHSFSLPSFFKTLCCPDERLNSSLFFPLKNRPLFCSSALLLNQKNIRPTFPWFVLSKKKIFLLTFHKAQDWWRVVLVFHVWATKLACAEVSAAVQKTQISVASNGQYHYVDRCWPC